MMSIRTATLRTASRFAGQQTRLLSSQGTVAVERLRTALEEYRVANYQQELPTRFKKDILRAAAPEQQIAVGVSGLERVLQNIGATKSVSPSDIQVIFEELGNENKEIPVQKMASLL